MYDDIITVVNQLQEKGSVEWHLNNTLITLIPKVAALNGFRDFRPIRLAAGVYIQNHNQCSWKKVLRVSHPNTKMHSWKEDISFIVVTLLMKLTQIEEGMGMVFQGRYDKGI